RSPSLRRFSRPSCRIKSKTRQPAAIDPILEPERGATHLIAAYVDTNWGDGHSAPMTAVRAAGLRLRYGQRRGLDGVGFEGAAGGVVGLLGPNGAGKTSTLSILSTLRRPDAGDAEVAGASVRRDPARVRHLLGLAPQSLALYPTLTALENLRCFAGI